MQKREFAKSGGQSGGSSAPPAKRGRPFGSTSANSAAAAAAAAAAEAMSPSALLGPSLLVHNSFVGKLEKGPIFIFQERIELRSIFEFCRAEQQENSAGVTEWSEERGDMGFEHTYPALLQRKR